jgi:hypothetical protein
MLQKHRVDAFTLSATGKVKHGYQGTSKLKLCSAGQLLYIVGDRFGSNNSFCTNDIAFLFDRIHGELRAIHFHYVFV